MQHSLVLQVVICSILQLQHIRSGAAIFITSHKVQPQYHSVMRLHFTGRDIMCCSCSTLNLVLQLQHIRSCAASFIPTHKGQPLYGSVMRLQMQHIESGAASVAHKINAAMGRDIMCCSCSTLNLVLQVLSLPTKCSLYTVLL